MQDENPIDFRESNQSSFAETAMPSREHLTSAGRNDWNVISKGKMVYLTPSSSKKTE